MSDKKKIGKFYYNDVMCEYAGAVRVDVICMQMAISNCACGTQ